MEATATGISSGHEGGAVVGADLGISKPADPGADHVLGGSVQAHTAGRVVHLGHKGDDDVEESLAGALDTELGLSADESRAEVEVGTRALLGEPLGAVDFEESEDELLKLVWRESRERDAASRHVHTGSVAVRAEDAKLAVEATVDLETLEALGGIVQAGGGRHEAQGTVGLEFGGSPALVGGPRDGDHVIGGNGLGTGIGDGLVWDSARVLGQRQGQLGGIELGDGGLFGGGILALDAGGREVGVLRLNGGGRHDGCDTIVCVCVCRVWKRIYASN